MQTDKESLPFSISYVLIGDEHCRAIKDPFLWIGGTTWRSVGERHVEWLRKGMYYYGGIRSKR
jgi:hypothetical protein